MTDKSESRPYRDERDMERIRELQVAGRAANNGTYYVHRGDIDWWFYYLIAEEDRRANLRLWETDGRLLAWCLYSPKFGAFDLFVHPDERGSERALAMLRWGVEWATDRARASGDTKLAHYWLSQTDGVTLAHWQACGFDADSQPGQPILIQTLEREIELPKVPDGFTISDACTEDAFRLRTEALHGAFGVERLWEAYWQKSLAFFRSPGYVGKNNLFVRSHEGVGAAACVMWLDSVNKVGMFEPVGTHPAFQKMGLGKAVMREGLRRMKAAGMTHASVGVEADNVASNALYRSLGFESYVMMMSLVKSW